MKQTQLDEHASQRIKPKSGAGALAKVALGLIVGLAMIIGSADTPEAKRPRKLTLGAYISGAKIAMGKGGERDQAIRPHDALSLLDSCLIWYDQVPEAYFWKVFIYSSLARDSRGNPEKYGEYLTEMVIASDSLAISCDPDNDSVKKKRKKKCEELIVTADEIRKEWFVEFYGEAQDMRITIRDDLNVSLAEATDESEKVSLQEEIDEEYGKAIKMYELAGTIYPRDVRFLINLSEVYIERGEYEVALPLQLQAVAETKESSPDNYLPLLNDLAGSLYEMKMYDSAAAVFKILASEVDDDGRLAQYKNVVVCYSILDNTDSVMTYNHKILDLVPTDAQTLSTIGGLWYNEILDLNTAFSEAKDAEDKAKAEEIKAEINSVGDSARVYLQRAFESDPQDSRSIELYAFTSTMTGDIESALMAWKMMTGLKPGNVDYWFYVGDISIKLKKFASAIQPFEKVVELDPKNVKAWQDLAYLYKLEGQSEKSKAADAKVAELGG